jgi:hypothetical protein
MDLKKLVAAAVAVAGVCAPGAQAATLKAPAPQAPADQAAVQAIPAFTWSRVSGAAMYELQVAADDDFGSIVAGGSIDTGNTAGTLLKTVADGTYYWRVRGVSAKGKAGKWSRERSLVKSWSQRPDLRSPTGNLGVAFPSDPLVLRWAAVAGAYKYLVDVATDPSMANSVLQPGGQGVETSGTDLAIPGALAPGTYFWVVTPVDAQGHKGARSAVGAFVSTWNAATSGLVSDLNADERVYDPELSWQPVPGAVGYDVEVNYSSDFAVGSKVCCTERSIGTTVSPTTLLANNTYYWRVRAIDVNGNSGPWNNGPEFRKVFDDVVPTMPGLRMRDNLADPATDLDTSEAVLDTENPIVRWDPVPGASAYEVQVTEHTTGCDWGQRFVDILHNNGFTTNTSWVARSQPLVQQPGSAAWPGAQREGFPFANGKRYCVRVLAIAGPDALGKSVVSEFSQINGANQPAFRYQAHAAAQAGTPIMAADDYVLPPQGTITPRTPLFTWKRLPAAASYWVVISRDQSFTNVKEVGFTTHPAYAPRGTLEDETTTYYWVVIPAVNVDGSGVFSEYSDNAARSFEKRSAPPAQVAPDNGADVIAHPRFAWNAAEGARSYRLQVSTDPSFGDPLVANVTTAATSYTPTATYPADTVLYWRVRANAVDQNGAEVGLNWSPVRTFRRRLPTPALSANNPLGGEGIPVFSWAPVQGALGYDIHVEQADGTRKDFQSKTVAFTPTVFYGTGVWRWQVRATFPGPSGTSSGAYTNLLPFARSIGAPKGAKALRQTGRILLTWDASQMAKQYKVDVSTNTSFKNLIDSVVVDGTAWAPDLSKQAYASGGTLYWRVATMDEGANAGAVANGVLTLKRKLVVSVTAKLRRGKATPFSLAITDAGKQPIAGTKLKITGAGVKLTKNLRKEANAYLTVKPRRKGTITVTVTKKGYGSAVKKLRVR